MQSRLDGLHYPVVIGHPGRLAQVGQCNRKGLNG